jgi:DNA mismatch endonuclease (patch repair protein)
MDNLSPKQRSELMSRVRSSGNLSTELAFIRLMRAAGITGWRRSWPLVGKPDFVFPKSRLAVFIDGCFWHACPKHCRMPSSNREFWERKIGRNQARDRAVARELKRKGWTVIRFWEHDLKGGRGFTLKWRRLEQIVEMDAR